MNLSASASRGAAVGILIGISAALWFIIVQPTIISFFEHRESIAQSQEMLAKYRGIASTRADLDSSLRKLRAAQETEDRLLTGGSTQLVGAKLQNSLKESIETNGGTLTSMQVMTGREEEGFFRIPIAVTLTSTIEPLEKIIYTIETQNPYLFIENLVIQTNQGFTEASDDEQARNLQVHFDVYGYMPIQKK